MPVDSYKFLPRLIQAVYETDERQPDLPIPWTPLSKPLSDCKFGLITSGGLYHKGVEPPFDLEREKEQPAWGDPSFRTIPSNIKQTDLGVSHLHTNTQSVQEDINVLLPIQPFQGLVREGRIGSLAENAYSFMGYQGYPPDTSSWRQVYAPQVAQKLKEQVVDCVFLTPS